jgi:hypothetical protein
MGATMNYTFSLQADSGWNNTYIFDLGESLGLERTDGDYNLGADTVTWRVRNGDGNRPSETASLKLSKNLPTTQSLESENISLEFKLDSTEVEDTSLASNVLINSADISVYNVLPSFIGNLKFMPADGFRLFVNNGLITWDDTYDLTVKPIEEKIKEEIEKSSFNQTLDLIGIWDNTTTTNLLIPYDIQNMDNQPFLKAILTDEEIDLKICDISNQCRCRGKYIRRRYQFW